MLYTEVLRNQVLDTVVRTEIFTVNTFTVGAPHVGHFAIIRKSAEIQA